MAFLKLRCLRTSFRGNASHNKDLLPALPKTSMCALLVHLLCVYEAAAVVSYITNGGQRAKGRLFSQAKNVSTPSI